MFNRLSVGARSQRQFTVPAAKSSSRRFATSGSQSNQDATIHFKFQNPYKLHLIEPANGPSMETTSNREELLGFYKEMSLMRRLEIAADVTYKQKLIRGFLHLYNGQEAIASGIESELTPEDQVITAYRCHAHMVTRRCNSDVKTLLAELFGRQTGCSEGKGGSMHMYNKETNFYGGNGIVGAQVPVGAGLAFSQKLLKTGRVSVTYYGDGAANQGQVFEAYNLSALLKLPVIYVCENNQYGMGTSIERASATPNFYSRGDYIPGIQFDGMNVLQTREVAKFAVNHAKNVGPIVLEAKTYRYKGHSMSDPGTTYRNRDEVDNIRLSRDPILQVQAWLIDNKLATDEELAQINKDIKASVDEAVEFAKNSPYPPPKELFTDVLFEEDPPIRGTEGIHNGNRPLSYYQF